DPLAIDGELRYARVAYMFRNINLRQLFDIRPVSGCRRRGVSLFRGRAHHTRAFGWRARMRSLVQASTSLRIQAIRFSPRGTAAGNLPSARHLLIAVRDSEVSATTSLRLIRAGEVSCMAAPFGQKRRYVLTLPPRLDRLLIFTRGDEAPQHPLSS